MDTLLQACLSNTVLACVLALPAAAVARFGRRPALAHALWLLVLLKLITPPFVAIPVPWPGGEPEAGIHMAAQVEPLPDLGNAEAAFANEPVAANPLAEAVGPPAVAAPQVQPPTEAAPLSSPWRVYLLAAWLTVSALWFAWAVVQVRRFRRLLRHARLAPAEVQAAAQALAARLGRARPPSVWVVPGAISPMLWALGRAPRLLFPVGLLDGLDADQRDALLAHELAHWRRRDHWVRLVELFAFGLFWWHPLVWWARHELHEAEEQCCDAWAVWALDGDGRTYALALLQTLSFLSQARPALPVGASGVGQVRHLRRRLTMVMRGNTYRSLSWFGAAAVFGLGLSLLPVGAQDRPAPTPATPAAPDSREKDIQMLREALRLLEAQKTREEGKAATNKAAMEEARAAFAAAKAQYEQARAQLHVAESHLRLAERKLASLGIRRANGLPLKRGEDTKSTKPRFQPDVKLPTRSDRARPTPAPGTQPVPGREAKPLQKEVTRRDRERAAKALNDLVGEKHGNSVEQRLERLLREVEQLRQEIRGRRQHAPEDRLKDSNRANKPGPSSKE